MCILCPNLLQPHFLCSTKFIKQNLSNRSAKLNIFATSSQNIPLIYSFQLAVLHAAARCVTMLVEPPYLWSPDTPDANGWTAMQMAEALNDLHVMYPLACVSRELRHMEPVFSRSNNQLSTTHLFWPQDLMTGAFLSPHVSQSSTLS